MRGIKAIGENGFRELTPAEWELVAGGNITVTAPETDYPPDDFGYENIYDGGEYYGGGSGSSQEEYWDEREKNFKMVLKPLIPADPVTKEVVATAITEIRNFLIDAASPLSKAGIANWFDSNVERLANYFFGEWMDTVPSGSNPLDSYRSIFGGPDVPDELMDPEL